MAIAPAVESAINEWLSSTHGYVPYIATETGANPISADQIMELARQCEWVEREDNSSLSGVHPQGLIIGWGDLVEYCTSSGKAEGSEAHFLTAYKE